MNTTNFEKLIASGIKNLPADSFKENANYVFFIRKKTFNPKEFKDELEYEMLNDEMRDVSNAETKHLEKEFKDYEKKYPIE